MAQAVVVPIYTRRANEVAAQWVAESLWRDRSGERPLSLEEHLNEVLVGPFQRGSTPQPGIAVDRWSQVQAWPRETCEGAFIQHPANGAVVDTMRRIAR